MDTWSFSWAVRNLVAELLIPPGIWILLILIAIFAFRQKHKSQLNQKTQTIQKTQKIMIVLSVFMIWLTSTNYLALQLTGVADHLLSWPKPLVIEDLHRTLDKQKPQAIVILGSGRRQGALDAPKGTQNQDVSSGSVERLRLGARLAKTTQLPVLVTGGAPDKTGSNDLSEAELMARVLKSELGIQARWVEGNSNTTQENAKLSVNILKKENIQTIYLVTHFWHMPRAKAIFEKESLNVIEAPMGFYQKEALTPLDFYPSSEGFQRNRWIFHEILGSLWYRVKF